MFSNTLLEGEGALSEKKIASEEFVVVEVPYSLDKYNPYQINVIFDGWLREKKESNALKMLDTVTQVEKFSVVGWIFKYNGSVEKTALFKVANFPLIKYNYNQHHPSLDAVLKSYKHKGLSCDKLVIPIAELGRVHFRLLVIKPYKNMAVFYDSKPKIIGQLSEMGGSFVSAYQSIEGYKQISTIGYELLENYYYIQSTCEKYFPKMKFFEVFLGHQQSSNHKDCGPFTVEYAISEISRASPSKEQKIDIDQARGYHEELFRRASSSRVSPLTLGLAERPSPMVGSQSHPTRLMTYFKEDELKRPLSAKQLSHQKFKDKLTPIQVDKAQGFNKDLFFSAPQLDLSASPKSDSECVEALEYDLVCRPVPK